MINKLKEHIMYICQTYVTEWTVEEVLEYINTFENCTVKPEEKEYRDFLKTISVEQMKEYIKNMLESNGV